MIEINNSFIFYYNKNFELENFLNKDELKKYFITDECKPEKSILGSKYKKILTGIFEYKKQSVFSVKKGVDLKELLETSEKDIKIGQAIEYYSTNDEFGEYDKHKHFFTADLTGFYSGFKLKGDYKDIIAVLDDIVAISTKLELYMFCVRCIRDKEKTDVEIQMEFSNYFEKKKSFVINFLTKIMKKNPRLKMLAMSVPTEKWRDWYFFVSGKDSSAIRTKCVRYERTADPDYYWYKSAWFGGYEWFGDNFSFYQFEQFIVAYDNKFNWSEILEYPADVNGKEVNYCRAIRNNYVKKIILPETVKIVGPDSFYDCRKIQEIIMPSVEMIKDYAFGKCKNLKKIYVSDKLVSIADNAFLDCEDFEIVKI